MKSASEPTTVILGAGMVGVATALELQKRGAKVTLVDRKDPGCETSYGNAGIIARSSLVPLNNPALWKNLPKLMTNRTATLRYSVPYLLGNPGWALGFLTNARRGPFEETAAALDALIRISSPAHRKLMGEAGILNRLNERGWMVLYRSEAGYAGSQVARDTYAAYDIATETLDGAALRDIEPALMPIFHKAIWIRDSCSVDSPGAVVAAYAKLFADRGGRIVKAGAKSATAVDDRWKVTLDSGELDADRLIVALGPWSRAFLERMAMKVPMAFERGYHMHYSGARHDNKQLGRPLFDTSGGYVLSPMEQGLRLTTGVELTDCDAPANHEQLTMAEASARQAIDLGERVEDAPWLGRRPTMPDSRPVIGAAPGRKGLYLAFGHQHIGFSTGPGTARLLADLIEGKAPEIRAEPFSPTRFIR